MALLLSLGQCKKNDIIDGEWIHITVKVNNDSKHIVYPETGAYIFSDGDTIYVGNNGKYVGCLGYKDGTFRGYIASSYCSTSDYLHFYFMGGCGPATKTLTAGTTASITANITDQRSNLPVIAYNHSTQVYDPSATSYTSFLFNKCGLAKFNVNTPSAAAICIKGLNNRVTVDLAGNELSYDQVNEGLIKMAPKDASNATWAILLPQEPTAEGEAYTEDGLYTGTRPALIYGVSDNEYFNLGITLNVNASLQTFPLTFEAKTAGATVTFTKAETLSSLSIEYSTDGTTWTTYTTPITLANVGDKVSFRGTNEQYATDELDHSHFSCSNDCYVYGNIMSLIHANDYGTIYELSEKAFISLFEGVPEIDIHPEKNLVLPATTLAKDCYENMFQYCTGLTRAPELPAITLAYGCYSNMFDGCTSLTAAPELPATTLAEYCYFRMFDGCTSLTAAPELPATTLAEGCYYYMFTNCTNLTDAPELPATTLAEHCYESMFSHTSLTTAPALPATTLAKGCYYYMFCECSSLQTAPELPATTLTELCYEGMFKDCTSLTTAPELPATTLVQYCYRNMFNGCSNLNSITCLATSGFDSPDCTTEWVNGVSSSGTFTKASGATWNISASGIPSGWTIVEP